MKPSDTNPPKGRGHKAARPREIPGRGWKDIALRVKDQLKYDHIQVVAAGVAFYFFLAHFPTLAAAISIYGLLTEPAQAQQQITQLSGMLPEQAHQMISSIMAGMAEKSGSTLGWSVAISILLSLWSANKGTSALFEGVNVAYDEIDERNMIQKYATTLLFKLGGIVLGIIGLAIVAGFPAVVGSLNLSPALETTIQLLRWPIVVGLLILALSLVYKKAPDRSDPKFKWVSWGSVCAALVWLLGSLLFTLYVNNFGSYDQTYGSFAAVIILMLWFFLTAFIVLLGAEINSEMEHQTRIDTTVGPDAPMGQRGAYHADHLADGSEGGSYGHR